MTLTTVSLSGKTEEQNGEIYYLVGGSQVLADMCCCGGQADVVEGDS